jgi:radical SAM superfamily enzyme YgiQ (UPF0313 family)
MKIALIPSVVIDPDLRPRPHLPLGLFSLKSLPAVREVHDIDVLDLNCRLAAENAQVSSAFYDMVAEELAAHGYEVVGFSSLSTSFHHVVSIAQRVKSLDRSILIVVGGPGPQTTELATEMLRTFSCIDYIVVGEGERVFPNLLTLLSRRSCPVDLAGVFSRYRDGWATHTGAPPVQDLDSLPFLDLRGVDVESYFYAYDHTDAILRIEEGRGCPFTCSFCSTCDFWRHQPRRKSAARLIAEMDLMNRDFSVHSFSLVDDCFNASRGSMKGLCEGLVEAAHPYRWGCSVRMDLMNQTLLDLLWGAGCRGLFAGLESGSDRIQRITGKRLGIQRALENLEYALQKGFHIITSFVIGFPEETRQDLRETMELHARVLDMGVAESQMNLLTPLQGSRLFREGAYPLEFDDQRSHFIGNVTLPEHLEMIREHVRVFAAFYHFKLENLSRKELIEIEALARLLAESYRSRHNAE